MNIITHAYARAGLVGNPSDGYGGKTISFIIRDFQATVQLNTSSGFEIVPAQGDFARFDSVRKFLDDQRLHGYYGGMRLVKAAIKRFHEYCDNNGIKLPDRGFTVRYGTTIPRLVGLSGSSAIVVAMLRALLEFYEVKIPLPMLPELALSVERDELQINAGLQDRVIQWYEGIVYMDFETQKAQERGYGEYVPLKPPTMPALYVAYDPERAEVSDVSHRELRRRFANGEPKVVAAMNEYRELTDRGRKALMEGDWDALGQVMNANYDLRRTIMTIAEHNHKMIEAARATGASAKFAGSGGAICGLYRDSNHFQQLTKALAAIRCTVLQPKILPDSND